MNLEQFLNKVRDDRFIHGYLEAALWSSTYELPNGDIVSLGEDFSFSDISPTEYHKIIADCDKFQEQHGNDLIDGGVHEYSWTGHDFWLTRNGHGAGFWDGDWPEPQATILTNGSHQFVELNLYIGDDGMIHGF